MSAWSATLVPSSKVKVKTPKFAGATAAGVVAGGVVVVGVVAVVGLVGLDELDVPPPLHAANSGRKAITRVRVDTIAD